MLGERLDDDVLRGMNYLHTVALPKIRKRLEEREREEEARWTDELNMGKEDRVKDFGKG